LRGFLFSKGFEMGKVDKTLFLPSQGNNILIVHVYVDDIVFGGSSHSLIARFAEDMSKEFEMSMMGELQFFLGLQAGKGGPRGVTEAFWNACCAAAIATGLTGTGHRSDRCSTGSKPCKFPLCVLVCFGSEGCLLVPRSSSTPVAVDLANLGSESETCVGSRVFLVGVFISF
jgi:hypothetical protein